MPPAHPVWDCRRPGRNRRRRGGSPGHAPATGWRMRSIRRRYRCCKRASPNPSIINKSITPSLDRRNYLDSPPPRLMSSGSMILFKYISIMQIRQKLPASQMKLPPCKYIIIDTDAGGDDSQAIILAVSEARRLGKTILGITCIDGNAALDDVAINVLISIALCGVDIPVYKGSRQSLMGPTHKDYYFSKDGIGLQQRNYVEKLKREGRWREELIKQGAVDFLVESINAHPGEVAVIAIGPLTNLALAYHTDNSIGDKLGLLSIMGGSISAFGIREFFAAEFNFYLDAQAANITMKVFPRIIINSFDLSFDLGSRKTLGLFTDERTEKAKFIHDIHGEILKTHRPSVCDPLACIPVFFPEDILSYYEAYGDVETTGKRTRGLLVFDWLRTEELPGRSKIMAVAEINLDSFIQRIHDSYN